MNKKYALKTFGIEISKIGLNDEENRVIQNS